MPPPEEDRRRVAAFLGATRRAAYWFYAMMVALAVGCGVATVVRLRDSGLDYWPDLVVGIAVGLVGYAVVLRWGLPGGGRSRGAANRVQMLAVAPAIVFAVGLRADIGDAFPGLYLGILAYGTTFFVLMPFWIAAIRRRLRQHPDLLPASRNDA